MGVYIKGMEMPKKYPVTVTIFPDGISVVKTISGRRFTATAVPVPLHGRIGDLDRLAKEVEDTGKEFPPDSIGAERYRLFAEFIKTAPTIFPADHEEEEMK